MNLHDLAVTRLQQLFPTSRAVRALEMRQIDDILARPQCRQKACPFPAAIDGLCKAHALDRRAEYSVMKSSHPPMTSVHGHGYSHSYSERRPLAT